MSDSTRENAWFIYECSENDGLKTMVQINDRDSLADYDDRDCETLKKVQYW